MRKIIVMAMVWILLSVQAWAEPSNADLARANVKCAKAVEKSAVYDFEWTESMFEMKFTFLRYESNKVFQAYGTDKIRFKNEHGEWRNYFCFCAWLPNDEQVLSVTCRDMVFQ